MIFPYRQGSGSQRNRLLSVLLLGVFAYACTPDAQPVLDNPDGSRLDAGLTSDAGDRPDARRDATPDATPDANPCEPLTQCGSECVSLETSSRHCGACAAACEAPANASPSCSPSGCAFRCHAGFERNEGECVATVRLLWPPALSTVNSRQPPFRWQRPDSIGSVELQICRDRRCSSPLFTSSVAGDRARPLASLPEGWLYWRVLTPDAATPIWGFRVRANAPGRETASGAAPDFNGDGFGDVVVGAPLTDRSRGVVGVHYGSESGPSESADQIIYSPSARGIEFGATLANAGDLNGDGFADLAVSAPAWDEERGSIHLYLGRPLGFQSSADQSMEGTTSGGRLGHSLRGAGDVDGDGFADLLASSASELGIWSLSIYKGFGGGVNGSAEHVFTSAEGEELRAASAGDTNGDGFADVVIGALNPSTGTGRALLLLGSDEGLLSDSPLLLASDETTPGFGASVAGLGDINGDGYSDCAVGASGTETQPGSLYIWLGGPTGIAGTAIPMASPMDANRGFGHEITTVGDVNGDGIDDLVVAEESAEVSTWKAWLFLGSRAPLMAPTLSLPFEARASGSCRGCITWAGDSNGDGVDDLVVGTDSSDAGSGEVRLFGGDRGLGIEASPLRLLRQAATSGYGSTLARSDG